ncbi:MAG: hypothetical protein RDU24_11770 [Humidesulfovibrio sp.]|uniref:hypothetical protein n=1 Tax=Humidesulfovibrio sp. TaxID=2910988 RepID=UPI0027FA5988|nr:hypothetical protein [Humidesulfovibrio sp.]MDQ7836051.1 hypothetical protein [Humidesulfovibrio sp.]
MRRLELAAHGGGSIGPLNWAATQNNLGAALKALAEKAQDAAKAREALKHYTSAFDVYSTSEAPYYRELVEENMRNVQALIEKLEKGK